MVILLIFALLLLLGVLISGLAERSVLSIAMLFLVAGIVLGQSFLKLIQVQPQDPMVAQLIEYGLLVLRTAIPGSDRFIPDITVVIVLSILAHSSTDIVMARWLQSQL